MREDYPAQFAWTYLNTRASPICRPGWAKIVLLVVLGAARHLLREYVVLRDIGRHPHTHRPEHDATGADAGRR